MAALLFVAVLTTVACSSGPPSVDQIRRHLAAREYLRPKSPPQITLTDQDGQPYHVGAETAGWLTYLYFGYTYCPDVCPITMASLSRALGQMAPAERAGVKAVFISLDPARDTPERIGSWLSAFDEDIVGLTGTKEEVEDALDQVGYIMPPMPIPEEGPYEVAHPADLFVITPDREIMFGYPSDVMPEDIVRDAAMLLDVAWESGPVGAGTSRGAGEDGGAASDGSQPLAVRNVVVVGTPGAGSVAVYASFSSAKPDTLLGITSVAGTGSIHEMVTEAGLMRMRPIEFLAVSGDAAKLSPGRTHGMIEEFDSAYASSDTIELVFEFARAGSVLIKAPFMTHAEYLDSRP